MSRIRTRRQAERLRPIARERARHSKFMPGDEVFYKGITWGHARIVIRYDTKPYRTALLMGRSAAFSGVLSEAIAADRYPRRKSDDV